MRKMHRAARAAGRAELEEVKVRIEATASKYMLPDGSPGLLAPGCWGWRHIAKELRAALADLEQVK